MTDFIEDVSIIENKIASLKDIILTNIVLLGQTPCRPDMDYQRVNYQRAKIFMERLSEAGVDECSLDAFDNPRALIKGNGSGKPQMVMVAHMDTSFGNEREYLYTIDDRYISGPGMMDNSLGVGVLMSFPEILRELDLKFESDLVLIGLVESLKESDLKSIREVLSKWTTPIGAALCIEGGELGRLDYFSRGMARAEIDCEIPKEIGGENHQRANAIIVLNEIINSILEIRHPLRPKSEIKLGKIQSGYKHGHIPLSARLGFEIHSDSDEMVEEVYNKISDICRSVSHHSGATIRLRKISSIESANLSYNHPLIRNILSIMERFQIIPQCGSSESELSVFLSQHIAAVTLGITYGENYHKENERALIEPIFKGIAQVVAVLHAIDGGAWDEG